VRNVRRLWKFVLENPHVYSDIRQRVNNHFVRLTSKETECGRTVLKCETDKEHVSGSTIAELEKCVTVEQLRNFVRLNPSASSEIRQKVNDLFARLTSQVESVMVKHEPVVTNAASRVLPVLVPWLKRCSTM